MRPRAAASEFGRSIRRWGNRLAEVARGVRGEDEARVVHAVEELSRSRRLFAPLALAVGGVAMLFEGVKLILSNWQLTVIQLLPAAWIWMAMYDLRAHVLHGNSAPEVRGPLLVAVILAIVLVTEASFFLNAVFGFAISHPGPPRIRPAISEARAHLPGILAWGGVFGLALALSATVVARAGRPWFTVSLGVVVGAMMVAYVAVPSRLIGVQATGRRRDRFWASAIGAIAGVVVATPPYVIGRIGLLMLGSRLLLIPGLVLFAIGVTLQAGATSAVRAVKMSAKLRGGEASIRPGGG